MTAAAAGAAVYFLLGWTDFYGPGIFTAGPFPTADACNSVGLGFTNSYTYGGNGRTAGFICYAKDGTVLQPVVPKVGK